MQAQHTSTTLSNAFDYFKSTTVSRKDMIKVIRKASSVLNKNKMALEWANHDKDVSCFLLTKYMGFEKPTANNEYINVRQTSANCVYAFLPVNGGTDVFVKLVPDYSTGDDLLGDAISSRLIDIFLDGDNQGKNHFTRYIDAGIMYWTGYGVPYKKMVDMDQCLTSYLYDKMWVNGSDLTEQELENKVISKMNDNQPNYIGFYNNQNVVYCNALIYDKVNLVPMKDMMSDPEFFANNIYTDFSFYSLCKTMFKLGRDHGFTHNDAHTENVVYDLDKQTFVLLDYGRVMFQFNAKSEVNYQSFGQEEASKLCKDTTTYFQSGKLKDLYKPKPYIQATDDIPKGDHIKHKMSKCIPVMNDIATLCWNVWTCISPLEDNFPWIKKINTFFKIKDGYVTVNFTPSAVKQVVDYILTNGNHPSTQTICIGLLWLAMYIKEFFKIDIEKSLTTNTEEIKIIKPYSEVCGTTFKEPLWHAGQFNTNQYNAVVMSATKDFSDMWFNYTIPAVTSYHMYDLITGVFGYVQATTPVKATKGGTAEQGNIGKEDPPTDKICSITDAELLNQIISSFDQRSSTTDVKIVQQQITQIIQKRMKCCEEKLKGSTRDNTIIISQSFTSESPESLKQFTVKEMLEQQVFEFANSQSPEVNSVPITITSTSSWNDIVTKLKRPTERHAVNDWILKSITQDPKISIVNANHDFFIQQHGIYM